MNGSPKKTNHTSDTLIETVNNDDAKNIQKKKRNFQSIIYLITTKKVIECFSKLGDLIITNGDTGRAAGLYYVEDYIAKVNYCIKNNQKTLQSNALKSFH